jgi:hypothetical protein
VRWAPRLSAGGERGWAERRRRKRGDLLPYALGQTRSDVGEMARLAAVETLARAAEPAMPDLFGTRPGDAQDAVARIWACSG